MCSERLTTWVCLICRHTFIRFSVQRFSSNTNRLRAYILSRYGDEECFLMFYEELYKFGRLKLLYLIGYTAENALWYTVSDWLNGIHRLEILYVINAVHYPKQYRPSTWCFISSFGAG